jgi:hypothetical protein
MWFAEALREPRFVGDQRRAQFITALNAGLRWRQVDNKLAPADRQRMRRLVG